MVSFKIHTEMIWQWSISPANKLLWMGPRAYWVQVSWRAWWVDNSLWFPISMFLFKCVTQTFNISTMTHVPVTFKGQSLRLQVLCDLCQNKRSYLIYPTSRTSLHKSWTNPLFFKKLDLELPTRRTLGFVAAETSYLEDIF